MTPEERLHALQLVELGNVSAMLLRAGCTIDHVDTDTVSLRFIDRALGHDFTLTVS